MAIKVKKNFFRHSIFTKLKIPFLAMLALTILPFSVVVISKKKNSISSPNSLFCPEIVAISKKKKVFTSISSPNSLFCPEIEAISLKKKRGLRFDFVSEFAILSRNRGSIEIVKGDGMSF